MPKVVYIQFANPEQYPPLEHGSKILVENGWKCLFFGRNNEHAGKITFQPLSGRSVMFMPRWTMQLPAKMEFALYAAWVLFKVVEIRPTFIYLSDPLATPIGVLLSQLGCKVIYHEHDTPSPSLSRWLQNTRKRLFRTVQFSVIPNAKRIAHEELKIRDLVEVRNFPSKADVLEVRLSAAREIVVCYFGTLVPSRLPMSFFERLERTGIHLLVQLMGYETIESPGYVSQLLQRFEHSVNLRFEFLGSQPMRDAMLRQAAQADAGLLFFSNQEDVNERAMVGASNKIGDYLAAGIPILCSLNSEFEALSGELDGIYPVGSETDLTELLLRLKDHYADASARIALQKQIKMRFNYETEFGPVLKRLSATLKT